MRIDVDQRRSALFGLDRPAEADRMRLRHVAPHDQDGIGVRQVLLEGRRPTPAETCPQTGDGRTMSYAGLVLDRYHAQAAGEQLLDQVVLLVIHGCAAQGCDGGGVIDQFALRRPLDERPVTGFFDQVRDPIQRPLQRPVFPVVGIRGAVANGGDAIGIDDVLKRRGALGAERALVDGGVRVTFDVDDPLVLDVDQLAAADRAVWTDRDGHLVRIAGARFLFDRLARHGLRRHAEASDWAQVQGPLTLDCHATPPTWLRGAFRSVYERTTRASSSGDASGRHFSGASQLAVTSPP